MNTRLLLSGSSGALEVATELLLHGQAVAFPTDTVYGVGVDALRPDAVESLYRVKGRPQSKAIPVLVSSISDLQHIAVDVPHIAYRLAEAFWPGALTIVVPSSPILPETVTAGGRTVAVRSPNHPFTLALLHHAGMPLATSSANLSGEPPPTTATEVLQQLNGKVPLIVDGGPCPGGIPSTVIDVSVKPARILRLGAITPHQVAAVVPDVACSICGDEA